MKEKGIWLLPIRSLFFIAGFGVLVAVTGQKLSGYAGLTSVKRTRFRLCWGMGF